MPTENQGFNFRLGSCSFTSSLVGEPQHWGGAERGYPGCSQDLGWEAPAYYLSVVTSAHNDWSCPWGAFPPGPHSAASL